MALNTNYLPKATNPLPTSLGGNYGTLPGGATSGGGGGTIGTMRPGVTSGFAGGMTGGNSNFPTPLGGGNSNFPTPAPTGGNTNWTSMLTGGGNSNFPTPANGGYTGMPGGQIGPYSGGGAYTGMPGGTIGPGTMGGFPRPIAEGRPGPNSNFPTPAPGGMYQQARPGGAYQPRGNAYGHRFREQYGKPPGQARDLWDIFRENNNLRSEQNFRSTRAAQTPREMLAKALAGD